MAKKPFKFTNKDDNFKGTNAVDDVNGKGGDDTINGKGGNDILLGGAGNDKLIGGLGDDRMLGGTGDDKIDARVGNDTVDGGVGDDRVTLAGAFADATVELADGYYVITIGTQVTKVKNVELFTFSDGTFETSDLDDKISGTVGNTLVLTTGVDNLVGGSEDDKFVSGVIDTTTAANTTLTAADVLAGGAGTGDSLSVVAQGSGAAADFDLLGASSITGIEVLTVRNVETSGFDGTVDANSIVGLTSLNNNLSTADVVVTNLADTAAVTITGNSAVTNGDTDVGYAAGATSADVGFASGVTAGAVSVTGTSLTTVAITSTGATNTAQGIFITPATNVTIAATTALNTGGLSVGTGTAQTLTITGAAANQAATATAAATAAVTLGTLDADFTKLDASGLTAGGVQAVLNASTTLAVTGGAGDDILTTGAVLTTGSVAAGAGTGDRLILSTTAHLATVALGAKYTGFEQLQVENGQTADLANISGITSVLLNDAGGATTFANLTATQAGAITVLAAAGSAVIGVSGAATVGQIDTVKLTYDDGDTTTKEAATNTTYTLTGVENLNVVATDSVYITQSNATSGDLTSVTLSGAGNIQFVTGNMDQVNFSLNASASTGTNILDASGYATNGVAITGGTGVDTITGSAQADVIIGGAGADSITAGAGVDSITGGDGKDSFIFATADIDTTAGAVTDTITDFLSGTDTLTFGFGAGSVTNYVEAASAAADLATLLAAADTALNGTVTYYVGQVGSDTYVVTDQDGSGYTDVVKLTGVALTGIALADIIA